MEKKNSKIDSFIRQHKFLYRLFYKTVVVEEDKNGEPIKTIEKHRSMALVYFAFVALIFGLSLLFIPINSNIQFDQFGKIFSQLFVPSKWSLKDYAGFYNYLFNVAVPRIWDTICMVGLATAFGVAISVPFYILASSNVVKHKAIFMPVRLFANLVRTIPTFVLAIIGAIFYGYSDTAGVFAMTIFTAGVIFKLMYEYIETCDMNPFEVAISNGATRYQAYRLSIAPQIKPMFISNIIYTFEINIRASVVLGFVGAGGIGQLLSDAIDQTNYDKVGAILIPLFILVLALQLISSYLRRKIN
ncbi:MAG: phosphonate ABC transporter, permease protein PhnE [Bacilli bacterium]|nr:phosphonate ABC transporter, permease protein PhnE [Bacilli bacterium]